MVPLRQLVPTKVSLQLWFVHALIISPRPENHHVNSLAMKQSSGKPGDQKEQAFSHQL